MKIYNEVITIFNENTGLWETISENSYDYNGAIALAQGIPPNSTAVSAQDTIIDTLKTTAGYFTDGDGTLSGTGIHTASLTDSDSDILNESIKVAIILFLSTVDIIFFK